MRKKRQPSHRPPALADGWWWYRNFIPLRGGAHNYEWRIARVEGGKVKPFGMTAFLEPDHRYLRHALWHGPIEPPPLDPPAEAALALDRTGRRPKQAEERGDGSNEGPESEKLLAVARRITTAFVETSGDLRAVYAEAPDKLEEVIQQVATLIRAAIV